MWNILLGIITLGEIITVFFTHDRDVLQFLVFAIPATAIPFLIITEIRYALFRKRMMRMAHAIDAKEREAREATTGNDRHLRRG